MNSPQSFSLYQESILTAASRMKADIERCYNLLMEVKMSSIIYDQLELLNQVEALTSKVNKYCQETIREYQSK